MQISPQPEQFPIEVINGQIVAKANHYMAVPDGAGGRRIIKDKKIRHYEGTFKKQCVIYRDRNINVPFRLEVDFFYCSNKYDVDNSVKTLLDCLQYANAITNDNLCWSLQAQKHIDKFRPRVEYRILPFEVPRQAGELDLFGEAVE